MLNKQMHKMLKLAMYRDQVAILISSARHCIRKSFKTILFNIFQFQLIVLNNKCTSIFIRISPFKWIFEIVNF